MNTGIHKPQTQLTDLFILRTNIDKKSEFLSLKRDLQAIPGIFICTIDLEDRDRVLRVECENLEIDKIVSEVNGHGFFCEELED
ncbi:MAG: hypothetical protein ACLP05_08640 [Candidatus Kryptoniota bacterium]